MLETALQGKDHSSYKHGGGSKMFWDIGVLPSLDLGPLAQVCTGIDEEEGCRKVVGVTAGK